MAVSYTLGSLIVTIVGIFVAAFVFRQIVVPAFIYMVQYFRYGQKKAEEDALASMGENHVSYGLKDQMKRNQLIDDPNVNKIQDQAGEAVGGLVDGKGPVGGVGKGLSDVGNKLQYGEQ